MENIERCMNRCPIVAGLPPEARAQILGGHAIHLCPAELSNGQIGPLCGLPPGEDKNQATREALTASKEAALSTV